MINLNDYLLKANKLLSTNDFRDFKHYVVKILGINHSDIILNSKNIFLKSKHIKQMSKFIMLIKKSYPSSYIIKEHYFGEREFYVNSHTLIPRVDSWCLIELFRNHFTNNNVKNILELGVGSGCIIATILLDYINYTGVGVDVNKNTLKAAKKNIKKYGLSSRCNLIISDLFQNINNKFDCIISNPPYISISDSNIHKSVKKYEPHRALFAPHNGLYFYGEIFKKSHEFLKKDGLIIVEVGMGQHKDVIDIAHCYGYKAINSIKDRQNIIRSISFKL